MSPRPPLGSQPGPPSQHVPLLRTTALTTLVQDDKKQMNYVFLSVLSPCFHSPYNLDLFSLERAVWSCILWFICSFEKAWQMKDDTSVARIVLELFTLTNRWKRFLLHLKIFLQCFYTQLKLLFTLSFQM